MARERINITVIKPNGDAVDGASVTVTHRSSGAAAALYASETAPTAIGTNVATTDANGRVNVWLNRGAYNLTISGTGITTYVEPYDVLPGSDNAAEQAWLPDDIVGAAELQDSVVGTNHLATSTLNHFLKLFASGDRKIKFGTQVDSGSFGSVPVFNVSIAHGMGAQPSWAIVWADTGVSTGDSEDPIVVSLRSLDATNINIRCRTASGGTVNNPSITFYWLAIS